MRTKIAISTIGLLSVLSGCGGSETPTGSTGAGTGTGGAGAGGHGGGAAASTGAGLGGATSGTSGVGGDAATSSGTGMAGTGTFGSPCTKNSECASQLCVDTDATHAVCTKVCDTAAACPPAPEWSCATKGNGSPMVCLCQPSGPEICDGEDNNCDGVVDEGGCPELVGTASGPIADMDLASDRLAILTDKTIETLLLAGGAPATTLRSDIAGTLAIGTNSTTIFWIKGQMHQMGFTGLALPDIAITGTGPYSDVAADDTLQIYHDGNNIWKSPPWKFVTAAPGGPMTLIKSTLLWANGTDVNQCTVTLMSPNCHNVVAKNEAGPLFFATDGNAFYWAGAAGAIHQAAPPTFGISATILTGEPGISGLAVEMNYVYWSTSDGTTSTLWKLPTVGGIKTKLGGVTGTVHHLLLSGNHLYFDTGKLVWRTPT